MSEFHTSWLVDGPFDAADDNHQRISNRLSILTRPAPSDDELWHELEEVLQSLADPQFKRRKFQEKLLARHDRIAAWLTRPGTDLDPESGLPWSQIAKYRVIDHPDLGPVPQYVESARQLAIRNASEADRHRAGMIAFDRNDKLAALQAEVNAERLTWLRLLVTAARADKTQQEVSAADRGSDLSPRFGQTIY